MEFTLTALETVEIQDKGLKFSYRTAYCENTLPRGVLIICQKPDAHGEISEDDLKKYTDTGLLVACVYHDTVPKADETAACLSALIDKIREKYKYLPIIAMGTELSSISVRQLAYEESERLGGVILVEPTIPTPSAITMLKAKILCLIKGKDYVSDILGGYKAPLGTVISYIKKSNELDLESSVNEYPKHMPTLLVNAKNDVLFEALDDAYVSGAEKAECNSPEELTDTAIKFIDSVIEGVNEALSTDSFIYRGV
ncbi:MAG: hypothetical protein E7675_07680 [Ruminococcaceae bacterium]|nr:hypothetical protein [Oscillospiraceae bacterium]